MDPYLQLPTRKTRQARRSNQQMRYMIDYFTKYPHVLSGKFQWLRGGDDINASWDHLVEQLNNMSKDGKFKDKKSWQATFRDEKTKISKKVEMIRATRAAAGDVLNLEMELTESEMKLLGLIGFVCVEGNPNCSNSLSEDQIQAEDEMDEDETPIQQYVPVTTATSRLVPIAKAISRPLPITTAVSRSVPIATAASRLVPITTAISCPIPIATVVSHPVPIVTATSRPVSIATALSRPVPVARVTADSPNEIFPIIEDTYTLDDVFVELTPCNSQPDTLNEQADQNKNIIVDDILPSTSSHADVKPSSPMFSRHRRRTSDSQHKGEFISDERKSRGRAIAARKRTAMPRPRLTFQLQETLEMFTQLAERNENTMEMLARASLQQAEASSRMADGLTALAASMTSLAAAIAENERSRNQVLSNLGSIVQNLLNKLDKK